MTERLGQSRAIAARLGQYQMRIVTVAEHDLESFPILAEVMQPGGKNNRIGNILRKRQTGDNLPGPTLYVAGMRVNPHGFLGCAPAFQRNALVPLPPARLAVLVIAGSQVNAPHTAHGRRLCPPWLHCQNHRV